MAICCQRRGYVTKGPGVLGLDGPGPQVVALHGVGNLYGMCTLSLSVCLSEGLYLREAKSIPEVCTLSTRV